MSDDISDIDIDTAHELMSDFDMHHELVESVITELLVTPNQPLLHQLFREVHTVKGNAGIFGLLEIVQFVHALEDLIGCLRTGTLTLTKDLAEVILLAMDRARDLHQKQLFNVQFENLNPAAAEHALQNLTKTQTGQELQAAIACAINMFTNNFERGNEHEAVPKSSDYIVDDASLRKDLVFFRDLAAQLDRQSIYWQGRSGLIFRWAQKMNALENYPIDPSQLAAAVYLHDLGMSLLVREVVNKSGRLSAVEQAQLREHPALGMELVSRMLGWSEAAQIIEQHHERFDGDGYPNHIQGENIHPGARIIAILDAFFAIINDRADRARRRSILRGVSEINACANTQFCPHWVAVFNLVIRDEVREGLLATA